MEIACSSLSYPRTKPQRLPENSRPNLEQVMQAAISALQFIEDAPAELSAKDRTAKVMRSFALLRDEAYLQGSPVFATMMAAMHAFLAPWGKPQGNVTFKNPTDVQADALHLTSQNTTLPWRIWQLHFKDVHTLFQGIEANKKQLHTWKDLSCVMSPVVGIITTLCNRAWSELPEPRKTPHATYLDRHQPTSLRNCIASLKKNFKWLRSKTYPSEQLQFKTYEPRLRFEPDLQELPASIPQGEDALWKEDARLVFRLWEWMLETAETRGGIAEAQKWIYQIKDLVNDLQLRLGLGKERVNCALYPYARLNEIAARVRLVREYRRIKNVPFEAAERLFSLKPSYMAMQQVGCRFPHFKEIARKGVAFRSYLFPLLCHPLTADDCFPVLASAALYGSSLEKPQPNVEKLKVPPQHLFFSLNTPSKKKRKCEYWDGFGDVLQGSIYGPLIDFQFSRNLVTTSF